MICSVLVLFEIGKVPYVIQHNNEFQNSRPLFNFATNEVVGNRVVMVFHNKPWFFGHILLNFKSLG